MDQRWIVIIPAAGSGTRFGGDLPKQFLDLAGTSIIGRSAEAALAVEQVRLVIVPRCPTSDTV
jgi:2-C-methyl-D-erythritol 4-phosphate cytidylyltransferase